jgi:aspartyl/asparaginyl beta-hydroxylase (cupin superfamily)/Tfp pilus assembly protein PilF
MASTVATESQIYALMEAMDRAERAGNRREAERALAAARAAAPDHPGVLNTAGMRALVSGDPAAARPLLERATQIDPATPLLWVNLALAHRELRDAAAERDALEKALALDPRFYPALLQKARLFEREGKPKLAAFMYYAFLGCAPVGTQDPALDAAIEHARKALRDHDAALEGFLRPRVEEARARHGGARLERFDACFEALVGKRRLYAPQPTFLLYPRLPAIEFLEREGFAWLDAFDAASAQIRAEALAALTQAADAFVPYIAKPTGSPVDQWQELNNSKRWSTFFLLKNGRRLEEHLARCPQTAALLQTAPLCEIPGHAPTAFFSVLAPRTRIPAHTGVTNTRFIVHLPLVVPPGCRFRVGAETREWREGRAWVFDDTFEHEAWNDSSEPRIVLIFDVWNSFLTAPERDLVSVVTHGVQEFNEGESPFRQGG